MKYEIVKTCNCEDSKTAFVRPQPALQPGDVDRGMPPNDPVGGGQHEELKGEIVTDLQKELRNVITFIGRKAQGCEDECDPEAGEDCALALRVLDPGGWLKEFDRAFVFGFACGAFAFGIPLLILFILNLVKP